MNDGERRAQRFFEILDARTAQKAEEERRAAALAARLAPPDSARRNTGRGPTQPSPVFDERSAAAPPESPTPPAPPPAPPAPPAAPPPLVATALTLELPAALRAQSSQLPFRPALPERPDQRAARTAKLPVMRPRGVAETTPAGDDSIAVAREKAKAVLPFVARAPAAPISFPDLTLVQYAWLCAELWVGKEAQAAILARYRVADEASHEALHAHWHGQLVAQPAWRAAFEQKRAEYWTWLRAQRA